MSKHSRCRPTETGGVFGTVKKLAEYMVFKVAERDRANDPPIIRCSK